MANNQLPDHEMISLLGFPEKDLDLIHGVTSALAGLRREIETFDAALDLIRATAGAARTHGSQRLWPSIAAKGAVMTLMEIQDYLDGLKKATRKLPTLSADVDHALMEKATALFEEKFPDRKPVRNQAAHSAEHALAPDKHGLKEAGEYLGGMLKIEAKGGSVYIGSAMIDGQYASTKDGKAVGADLSPAGSAVLHEVWGLIYEAYKPAAEGSTKRRKAAEAMGKLRPD